MFTEVQITPVKPRNGLVAYCSVVYNKALFLGNIALIIRKDGTPKLGFPSKEVGDEYIGICHPIKKEVHNELLDAITERAKELSIL